MLRQILMGGSINVCNVVIHALFMTALVRSSQATAVKAASRPNLLLIAHLPVKDYWHHTRPAQSWRGDFRLPCRNTCELADVKAVACG